MPALIIAGVHLFCTALAYWAVLGEDEEAAETIYHYLQEVLLCPLLPICIRLDKSGIVLPIYSVGSWILVILINSLFVGVFIRLLWLVVATRLKQHSVQQGGGG